MTTEHFSVSCKGMVPSQGTTSVGFKRQTDCYQRYMLKFPNEIAVFHSLAELYHAALLEADPTVLSYVPQPFQLRVGGKRYRPDCYIVRNGQRFVVELKPRGEFDAKRLHSLEAFFSRYGMKFQVLANESYLNRSLLAQNWLTIIGQLYTTRDWSTDAEEIETIDKISIRGSTPLLELIDPGDRIGSTARETALFRLLHRGIVKANLEDEPLDYWTEFQLCT